MLHVFQEKKTQFFNYSISSLQNLLLDIEICTISKNKSGIEVYTDVSFSF